MTDFLRFIQDLTGRFSVHVEITYNKTCDWSIYVYKQNCAEYYPKSYCRGNDAVLCDVNSCDMELCFAKAQCEVKEWLLEHEGGY